VGLALWRRLSPLTRRLLPLNTPARAIAAGMLWGWLPCGLAYAMLIGAWLSASPLDGAALMAAFGLGTAPALIVGAGVMQALMARGTLRRVAAVGMLTIGIAGLLAPWLGAHPAESLLQSLAACLPGYSG
jgi:sulfite exporter TauE/SafE